MLIDDGPEITDGIKEKNGMKTRLSIVLLIVLTVTLTSCAAGSPGGSASEQVIRIGVVGPLTGDSANYGQSQLAGAQMKAKEINDANGPWKIELFSEDDASNCDQSVNATTKLITEQKVHAILGAGNSPCALAMVPVSARYKTPQFTFGVGTAITQQGSQYIFRVAASSPVQTKALATYAVKDLGHTNIAILFADDEYGATMAEAFREWMRGFGLEPVLYETFPRADKDFTGQLTKVKNSGATAMFSTGSYTAAALIAKQAQQMGLNLQILGDTGLASPKYIELGGSAVEGAILDEPFTITDPDAKVQEFVKLFDDQFDRTADGWVAEIYDTVGLIHEAVVKAGKADPQVIRDYAASLTAEKGYQGLLGNLYFDAEGNIQFPLNIVRVENGAKVLVKRQ